MISESKFEQIQEQANYKLEDIYRNIALQYERIRDVYRNGMATPIPISHVDPQLIFNKTNGARCQFNSECLSKYCTGTCGDPPLSSALPFGTETETSLDICRSSAEALDKKYTYIDGVCNIKDENAERLRQTALQSEYLYELQRYRNTYDFAHCRGEKTVREREECNRFMSDIYNELNRVTFGTFDPVARNYSRINAEVSQNNLGIENEFLRNRINYYYAVYKGATDKETLISDVKLGTVITTEIAAITSPFALIGLGSIGTPLFPALLAIPSGISTLNQTSSAVVAQIENPGSEDATIKTGLAILSWGNLITGNYLLKGATRFARTANTVVSLANIPADTGIAISACAREDRNALDCGGAIGAAILDFGFLGLDILQGDTLFRTVAQNVNPSSARYLSYYQTPNLDRLFREVSQSDSNIYRESVDVLPSNATAQLPNTHIPPAGRVYTQTETDVLQPRITGEKMLFAPDLGSNAPSNFPRIYSPLDVQLNQSLRLYNLTDQWAKVTLDKINELNSFSPIALRSSNRIDQQTNILTKEQIKAIEEAGWDVLDAIAPPQIANTLDQADDLARELKGDLSPPGPVTTVSTGSVVPTTSNLVAQRPPELITSIDQQFATFDSTPTGSGYIFTGGSSDYGYGPLSATGVVRKYVNSTTTDGTPIRVLDVGAASGGFLENLKNQFGRNVDLYGLSAQDFRTQDNPLNGIDYRIGDAENFRLIYPENQFDVITSSVTITHFKDPLSAVQEMYKSLKQGGVLMIDEFTLPGLEGQIDNLAQFLKSEGYEITLSSKRSADFIPGQFVDTSVNYLVIKKTADELKLPVRYFGINSEGRAVYSLTGEIPTVDPKLPAKVTQILTLPPVKYSGDPKSHFYDLISSEETWRSVYESRKEVQLQLAIDTGAGPAEIAALKKTHRMVEEAVEEYFTYLKPFNQQLENEARQIALGQQPSFLTRVNQSTNQISQRVIKFWDERILGGPTGNVLFGRPVIENVEIPLPPDVFERFAKFLITPSPRKATRVLNLTGVPQIWADNINKFKNDVQGFYTRLIQDDRGLLRWLRTDEPEINPARNVSEDISDTPEEIGATVNQVGVAKNNLAVIGGGTYTASGGQRLVIEPSKDLKLQLWLEEAREKVNGVPLNQRDEILNTFVHDSLRYATGKSYDGPTLARDALYASGKPVPLGEFLDWKTGLCREYAACMHVALADNGIPNQMVIGNITLDGQRERHAWIEFIDPQTKQWMAADPTDNYVLTRDQMYTERFKNVNNIKRQVFVWPENTSLFQRITGRITPLENSRSVFANMWEQRVVESWERVKTFFSNPTSERGSFIIPPLSEPSKNISQNTAGLPEVRSFIPPSSPAESLDYYGSEPQRIGELAPWIDPANSFTVYHGSKEAISVKSDFNGADFEGSLTLGTGLYTTLDEGVARNYAGLRSSDGSGGVVSELKIYDANILDLRERPGDLDSPNKPLSNKIAKDWLDYVESIKPIRTQPGRGGKFLDEIFDRMWNEYYEYLTVKVNSGNGVNIRELLGTSRFEWGPSPDWSNDFREFMLSRKIDGVIYIESGEGILRESNDATFILYNYEKIGTIDDWVKRIEDGSSQKTSGGNISSERGSISVFYLASLGVVPVVDYLFENVLGVDLINNDLVTSFFQRDETLERGEAGSLESVGGRAAPPYVYYSMTDPKWANSNINEITDATISSNGCGMAAGAMVTHMDPLTYTQLYNEYYGGIRGLFLEGYAENGAGTYSAQQRRFLEHLGYDTVNISGTPDEIKQQIKEYSDQGIPIWVTANIFYPEDNEWKGHHTIAVGVDENNNIIFNDPFFGEGVSIPDERIDQAGEHDEKIEWIVFAVIPESN